MRALTILAAVLVVVACGDSSDDGTVGEEIAEDFNEAMDKARAVEDELEAHKEQIDKAVRDAVDESEKP